MTKIDENIQTAQNMLSWIVERCYELEEENKKLKDDVDFYYKSAKQFREDAESWRKECERLLWLQLCWKTIAERIEDDKKVLRE